uniref:Uncharacterized protein n=1 Tax=Spongospora subterranea TaxID=70186 RepID=A0A0H5RAK3_9EUKA|eukprot:CRZ10687.1 hypothetical protein [Spongospora subterranea]
MHRTRRSCTLDQNAGTPPSKDLCEDDSETSVEPCESPAVSIDNEALQIADASRHLLSEATVLSSASIEQMQSAILARAVNDLSERVMYGIQQARTCQAPMICWCCNTITPPPETPLPAGSSLPVFVVSAVPEWLVPALHCGNVQCTGRQLGLQARPKYGEGISYQNAGLLIGLHVRGRWHPISWFLTQSLDNQESISEVNPGLTLQRVTLAILFRVLKPFDDYSNEVTHQLNRSESAGLPGNEENEDSENRDRRLGPQVNQQPLKKPKLYQFEESRRVIPSEELDGNARLLWAESVAIGFYTYSVKIDSKYGIYAMLNGIYVRQSYRRKGFARSAIQDFFRTVAPSICRRKSSDLPVTMALQAPVTKLLLSVMVASLDKSELSNIKCVHANCPLSQSVSVKSWAYMDKCIALDSSERINGKKNLDKAVRLFPDDIPKVVEGW